MDKMRISGTEPSSVMYVMYFLTSKKIAAFDSILYKVFITCVLPVNK